MKMKRYIVCLAAAALLACGCGKFVRDELLTMQNEIDQLHKQVADMNESLQTLKTVVDQLVAGGYVVDVKEFTDEDGRGGFTLVFNDGSLLKLYSGVDGVDGQDAVPPVIGLQQDGEDGLWYWTLDGEWILSPDGERFKAVGVDGVTPQVKIEEGLWFVSMDDGETWTEFGNAKGEDAVEVFSGIDVTTYEDKVVLTLADGTTLELPRTGKLVFDVELTLSLEGEEQTIGAGETIPILYTLTGTITETTLVTAGTDGRYKTRIERTSDTEGTVWVTCPDPYADGYIYLIASDGKGYSKIWTVDFIDGTVRLPGEEESGE